MGKGLGAGRVAGLTLGERLALGGYPPEYRARCELAYCSSLLLSRVVRDGRA